MTISVNLDEVAHDEPPHQDLRYLRIELFSSLVLKELSEKFTWKTKFLSAALCTRINGTKLDAQTKQWFDCKLAFIHWNKITKCVV